MGRVPTMAIKSIYGRARVEAAKNNKKFKSRERAAEEIGISKDSLVNYELGKCKVVPPDVVVIIAEVYQTPHLLNQYCSTCPIGRKICGRGGFNAGDISKKSSSING